MKVAINGAGVAGSTLAYWLRQFGHEPVLFEKAPRPRPGGYLVDFWGLGLDIAERMGILPDLREHAYPMERVSIVDAVGGELAGLDVAPIRSALGGRFLSLARGDLAQALFEACRGVRAEFGVSIVGLQQDRRGVSVTLSDRREERFDFVVGADGLHSQVRELVFGPCSRFEKPLGCHVAAFRLPDYPARDDRIYVSHTVPKRHVARVVLRGSETLVLLIWRSHLLDGEPRREWQRAALRKVFGTMQWEVPEILRRLEQSDEFYFDRVSQIRLERWTSGRVALVGDAAAGVSLLAGEGTGLAMIEAYVLAGELERAGGDPERGFFGYQARLRSFVARKQRAVLQLRGFFTPNSALTLGLRNLAIRALSWPSLSKRVLPRVLRDELRVPEYGTPGWLGRASAPGIDDGSRSGRAGREQTFP